ncbi:MAG: 4-(cytidine 5'-diphospho)-2-C-methyl-D-erythritol kinase [Candidatus Latescibacteria bacterium]|nr:4-(cytidine 5'-diphospho)-2-C-methyl-D-erythritol kinase [Candidatus Latescibacterota bacterium]
MDVNRSRRGKWVEKAWAKINLGLKVLHRRPDGFHEIRSVVQTIDLADEIHLRAAGADDFTCTQADLPMDPDNLVRQALGLFRARLGGPARPVQLHLAKRIPMGAGLGGGSADAAATLRLLNHYHGSPFPAAALLDMAAQLGSDVPFLVAGGTALMQGRGEVLTSLEWAAPIWYVLVYPPVAVDTAWAYGHIDKDLTGKSPYVRLVGSDSFTSDGCVDHQVLFRVLENDFQPLIERTYPIVAELSAYLDLAGPQVCSMTGSGSTVYAAFDDREAAARVHRDLRQKGHRSFLCEPVDTSLQRSL